MIHFFPRFAKNAGDTPFGTALRATGAPHRIFGGAVQQTYRYRWQLLLAGYPRLAWASLGAARRSLFTRDSPPDAVVLSSDVEVLVFALLRLLPGAAKPGIVLLPFIYTARTSGLLNRLRLAYYRFVLRRVGCAICHSALEVGRYEALFAGCGARFTFVRWGTHVPDAATILAQTAPLPDPGGPPVVVAAGKSGRDYPTFATATAAMACQAVIICNEVAALGGVTERLNLAVLRNCMGWDYLRQVLAANVVVVPLLVDDISAGQMVLIQAMALGRPLVVTRTRTIDDYLEDGTTALLVPRGDAPALRAAIERLLAEPALAASLALNAQAQYASHFSGTAFANQVVNTVQAMLPARRHG